MDEFKKYLQEHRSDLDVEAPPRSEVWQHIQQQVPVGVKKVITPFFRRLIAACVVLIIATAAFMMWNKKPQKEFAKKDTPAVNNKEQIPENTGRPDSSAHAISPLPGEVIADKAGTNSTKTEKLVSSKRRKVVRPALSKKRSPIDALQENYASVISLQLKKLESTPIRVESPDYFHAFKKQWYDMDKDEKKIKEDIKLYGLTDKVLEQFIQLYQQKLLLLKQLQDEINKMNNRALQYPEMQSKSPSFLKM